MNFFLKLFPSRFKREGDFFVFISETIGFKPANIHLYELAFRHSSASERPSKKLPQNNERLEFLGDAILGTIVADYLYQQYPEKDEGFLTSMRSKIVSRSNLNEISRELGIQDLVVSNLDKKKPAKSLGGDTLEALIGAIYLDKGIASAKIFVHKKIIEQHVYLDVLEQHIISYKGLLIEWAQKERKQFEFSLLKQWGKQHNMTFEMGLFLDEVLVATGKGSSKKRAEEEAAEKAFSSLQIVK